ncbi:MAG: efflux RND transporter permease subunit, partial [Simkania sp.]|nr:efflux RND transporter permease subunit [Simkania sp.]
PLAMEDVKTELRKYPGLLAVEDDFQSGKLQIQPRLKESARFLGLTEAYIGRMLHHAFGGEELSVFYHDREEVKTMLRFAYKDRAQLETLKQLRILLPNGKEAPVSDLVDFVFSNEPSQIVRNNGRRRVTLRVTLDNTKTNPRQVLADLKEEVLPRYQEKYRGLNFFFSGVEVESENDLKKLEVGFVFAVIVIFSILAVTLNSCLQTIVLLFVVPLGYFGAVLGHWILGRPMSLVSLFGIVALAGIVVNDALILIVTINKNLSKGKSLFEAVHEAGISRFRAIVLTTVTTVAGILPIILEKAFMAQFMIPMAISVGAGLMFATILTLYFIPCLFIPLNWFRRTFFWLKSGTWPTPEEAEPAYRPPQEKRKKNLNVEVLGRIEKAETTVLLVKEKSGA